MILGRSGRWFERAALVLLLLIFTWFTWRGLTMFFSGDDMMNMYAAWNLNPWRLARAQVFIWMPVYRPVGGAIYWIFFALFGFHPEPLYTACWLLLVANLLLAYRWFRTLSATIPEALLALSLILVHGSFQDLYISAGTIYDRLWFLFTVLGLTAYAKRPRRSGGVPEFSLVSQGTIVLLCLLSMSSKESGVALPLLCLCYEVIFYFPEVQKQGLVRAWLRALAPLYSILAILSLVFIFGRVKHTPELALTPAYRPHASISVWLTRMSEYGAMLSYQHISFTAFSIGALLFAMAVLAVLLRNRVMLFGLAFFLITITPVALITARPGYVLYVPNLGLGLFFAAALAMLARRIPQGEALAFVSVTIALTLFHARNWPAVLDTSYSPERRLTEQFRREYPTLPPGTKLLFVNDSFPKPAWDLLFNLRMLYGDKSIIVHRLEAPPDQRPDPKHPIDYDHVFVTEGGGYVELDNRNLQDSIRLHILRDYAVGRETDTGRRDFAAYVVSGVSDGEIGNPTRWTSPSAKLKFELYPAPAEFSAKFWLPDFVANSGSRTLAISVNGSEIGVLPLTHEGMNEISYPVPASLISRDGFTLVDMNVTNPYRDKSGQEFGVVLLRAGFRYRQP